MKVGIANTNKKKKGNSEIQFGSLGLKIRKKIYLFENVSVA